MKGKQEAEVRYILETYRHLLYRTAYVFLGNEQDVADILQEVLIKYIEKAPVFLEKEHEKAWLLKVTVNTCKDFLRFQKRHRKIPIEEIELAARGIGKTEEAEILQEILELPMKWKSVLLLHYVEGYQLKEIAGILGITENAVKKRLQRGREALRLKLEE